MSASVSVPRVDYFFDSHISFITLTDSEGGNLLNPRMLKELEESVTASLEENDGRIICIQSSGASFCLGMDLIALEKEGGKGLENALDSYIRILKTLYTSPKPVVSVLRGPVKAGGVGLIGASDIVVAREDATVELTEAILGLIPANVLPYLVPRRMTPQQARYLIITAKKCTASEAFDYGLVDEVYPEEKLSKGLKKLFKQLLRISPLAISETKETVSRMEKMDLGESQFFAREKLLSLLAREDRMKHIRAFNEGTTPPWFERLTLTKPIDPGGAE